MRRLRVIGVGPGDPELMTYAAARAIESSDYLVVTDRSGTAKQGMPAPLLHAPDKPVVRVQAVPRQHDALARSYADVLAAHPGDAGFVVWGDPAFHDATIAALERVVADLGAEPGLVLDVVPGVSSVQLLAARHRLVLQGSDLPLHVTTGRELADAVRAGQDNLLVMINRTLEPLAGLDDWSIWWGGNLGSPDEELVAGRVADVLPEIHAARDRLTAAVGWVLDIYLLRKAAG